MRELKSWFTSLKLTLNASKTETMLIGTSRALGKCHFPGLVIDGCLVEAKTKVRSLGVILDQQLNMESHVLKIRSSAFCHLRLIARTKKFTSRSARLLLVHSYVVSHVNFCTSALCGINSSLITKIQAIFNSAMRLVYSVKKTESIASRLSEHQWLSVEKHIELRTLLFLISILWSGEPVYLHKQLVWYVPARKLRSVGSNTLSVPRTKGSVGDRAFTVVAPKLWNALPTQLREELLVRADVKSSITHYFNTVNLS
jgi:hypothetical protein